MNKPQFLHTPNLVRHALELIEAEAKAAIAARGRFVLSLSGGNTPRPVYEALAKRSHDWTKWLFTFGDERCVPPDDDQSNYRMANETLFKPAGVPSESVLRMKGEIDPASAAAEYDTELRALTEPGDAIFRHDLILLGIGSDGHTASLFPGTSALHERERLVIENYVQKLAMWRLTFTYTLLNAARHVCFLVSRPGKERVLDDLQHDEGDYPCRYVRPIDGKLTWLIGE